MDIHWMQAAWGLTRRDGAVGVDGLGYEDDAGEHAQEWLADLLERAKSGTYQAPPVRRVHIPKGSGPETRPIGIPTDEDKVLQRAVVMVLETIYEQDFLDGSYGFRPGRSAHQALQAVWQPVTDLGGCWIVEVDIRKFFDTLDRAHLRELLKRRVQDGVWFRLIGKWLHAGVLEEGTVTVPEAGTPQGGVISPLLANGYRHDVLDVWFAREVQPLLNGRSFLVRYADDFVMGFACEADARRVLAVLPKRFGKYGLARHPDQTRLVPVGRPRSGATRTPPPEGSTPGTFDLLGFTHYWGRSYQGYGVVKRRTAQGRLSRALQTIAAWCRFHRHDPIAAQPHTLSQKLRGHYAYYGITGNGDAIRRFRYEVGRIWRKWLSRRRRCGFLSWDTFNRLLKRFALPAAIVVHSVYRTARQPVT
jgi:group II intron reverse transcriptase/maturase